MTWLAAVLPIALGWSVVSLAGLRRRDDGLAYFGWVLAAGGLGTALVVLLWLLLGGAPGESLVGSVFAVSLALCGAAWIRRVRGGSAPPVEGTPSRFGTAPGWQRAAYLLVVAGVIGLAGQSVSSGLATAVARGDDAIIWTHKARLITDGEGLGPGFVQLAAEADRPEGYWAPLDDWLERKRPELEAGTLPQPHIARTYHLDYPLLNPALQVYAFSACGAVVPWQSQLPILLGTVALLLVLAGALARVTNPLVAGGLLTMLFALHETRDALTFAYADGLVALGLLLAADGLRRARCSGRGGFLVLAAIGLALLVWSKHEGLMHALALVGGCAVLRVVPWRRLVAVVAPAAAIVVVTWWLNARFGFGNDVASGGSLQVARLPEVLTFFATQLWSVGLFAQDAFGLNGHGLVPVFVALVVLTPRESLRGWSGAVALALVAIAAGEILVYLATPHDVTWHLSTSARRLAWQSLPLTALWIGAWSGRVSPGRPIPDRAKPAAG